MKLLPEYLKARSKVIFLFLALEVIFIVTDVLFGMRSIIVIYPVLLSLAVLLIAGVADMVLFCRRHSMLEREELPEAKSLIEEDYRKIIEKLKEDFYFGNIKIDKKQENKEAIKYLLVLEDGNKVEAVLMKHDYGRSVCISSQIGCNIGCSFCESGRLKKVRHLETHEMVEQILIVEEILK